MLFGSEEQKQKWLPLVAKDHISAFLLTEPDVGSDPARLGSTADADRGRLPAQRPQAVGDQRRDRRHRRRDGPGPEVRDGHKGGISAFVLDYTTDGVTVEHRNAFMGLRGIENSVTVLENVFVPEENLIGKRGHGPQDRPLHAQHRPPRAAGDLRRQRQVGDQDRARVVQRARAVGPAGRQARRRRAEDRLHRGDRVRPGGDARRLLPPGRRQEERHPHRGRDRQALRLRERLAGARRPDADPRRPRLRDRRSRSRTAARSPCPSRRRCATCASTASSRAPRRSCTC